MTDDERWEKRYKEENVEEMPWYTPELDPDLDQALSDLEIAGGKVLDLGTGPGTQAIALAGRGFEVTGVDLSPTAVSEAAGRASEKGVEIRFLQDNILETRLKETFDFIFDRGCFHVFSHQYRDDYIRTVHSLLKEGGLFFLKCFSHLEPSQEGPYRFSPNEIREWFTPRFHVRSIRDTVYHGTRDPLPKALFCILEKS